MLTQVKICGLTRAEDVETCISEGVGFLGFIIEAPSPRRLSVAQAKPLFDAAKGLAKRVAVTVNADDDLLENIALTLKPDYVQFHGDESVDHLASIAKKYDFKIIKACPIASDADMKAAGEYAGIADIILFDAKPPKGSDVRGGHGIAIDWNIIRRAPTPKFYALAGGLNPDTIADAIAATNAPMVDVSSGVESIAGVKDAAKIEDFMRAIKDKVLARTRNGLSLSNSRTKHVINGKLEASFESLKIIQLDGDSGFYLFYFKSGVAEVTDTYHDTFSLALEQARFEFGINEQDWEFFNQGNHSRLIG
jgi:phosphoribosylanthranilate isomerase